MLHESDRRDSKRTPDTIGAWFIMPEPELYRTGNDKVDIRYIHPDRVFSADWFRLNLERGATAMYGLI